MNEVTNTTTYGRPIVAIHREQPVRIIATGDRKGSSPVCQYIDENGKLDWAPQSEFEVIDPNFLPPSKNMMSRWIGRK